MDVVAYHFSYLFASDFGSPVSVDMKNGLINKIAITAANETDAQFIVRAYEREDWAIELEAFTFMRRSNSYVAAVVNHACN